MDHFCSNCGAKVNSNAYVCLKCGARVNNHDTVSPGSKSKLVAGLLGIFLGSFGIHNFYLGYTNKAIAQLLITILGACIIIGPCISSIWGLIEGILILTGSINKDAKGNSLKE